MGAVVRRETARPDSARRVASHAQRGRHRQAPVRRGATAVPRVPKVVQRPVPPRAQMDAQRQQMHAPKADRPAPMGAATDARRDVVLREVNLVLGRVPKAGRSSAPKVRHAIHERVERPSDRPTDPRPTGDPVEILREGCAPMVRTLRRLRRSWAPQLRAGTTGGHKAPDRRLRSRQKTTARRASSVSPTRHRRSLPEADAR